MTTTLIVPHLDVVGPDHWQTWLEKRLPRCAHLRAPEPRVPDLSAWAASVRWAITQLPDEITIVAHGFGCLAAVLAASDHSDRVAGAMLVAPADPARWQLSQLMPETPLGFPSVVVASTNDPKMRLDKAAFWAGFWSSELVSIGAAGGVDPESGFGPWPQGLEILERLKGDASDLHAVHRSSAPISRSALAV